jgi:hypothetical protein
MALSNCYSLISCNPLDYPDITNLCWNGLHPYDGLVVYITDPPVNPQETYTLTLIGLGINECPCAGWIPNLRVTTENNCVTTYDINKYVNCEDPTNIKTFGFPVLTPVKPTIKKSGDCECWNLVSTGEKTADELIMSFDAYDDCQECLEDISAGVCDSAERTIGYAQRIKLPEPVPPDRGFSKCCYLNLVLADLTDNDPYHNDYTGSWYKRQLPNTTVDFKLVDVDTATDYALNNDLYGTFQDFGGVQEDLTYYIVDWLKVLTLLGEGNYQIKQELTIAGISIDLFSDTYTLKQFSIEIADKTVRIDSIMDGKLIAKDADFKDSGYKTSMRLRGFFGRAEYSFEQDNIATRDYNFKQNTMSSKREYKFQGLQLPECITDELFNFMLFGAELFISDYNGNNHSYKYELVPVKLEGNSGTEFFVTDRGVNVNLTFSDRTENDRKINC